MSGRSRWCELWLVGAVAALSACALHASPAAATLSRAEWQDVLGRAQVWSATPVSRMNLRLGPRGAGTFEPNELVECTFRRKEMGGRTPKFTCVLSNGDEVKVKYGRTNGEVYAEVAASRLLWALGFGSDEVYPVRIRCRACPVDPYRAAGKVAAWTLFEHAAVERKAAGRALVGPDGPGWSWTDLDRVGGRVGAPAAQRDALKLLAAMIQHTDSKREQQRLVCLDAAPVGHTCARPFLLLSDLGKTFGRANALNRDSVGSANLRAWSSVGVWADETGCRARLDKSMTGTLEHPVISEAGRVFLLERLRGLTVRQLNDLFTVSRFAERAGAGEPGDVQAWVEAFLDKVRQVASRSCRSSGRPL